MQHWKKLFATGVVAALTACGGGGEGGAAAGSAPTGSAGAGGDSAMTTPAAATAQNKLFVGAVSDRQHIALLDSLVPGGSVALNEVLDLPVSDLELGLAYDGRRDLLYSHFSSEIVVYEQASTLKGGAQPTRRISLPAGTHNPSALQLDAEQDVLYIALGSGDRGQVLVYEHASALANGTAPGRTFTLLQYPASLGVDTGRRVAYWVGGSGGDVFAFSLDSASMQDSLGPTRLRVGNAHIALDASRDRIYAAADGKVRIFEAASTAAPREVGFVPLENARAIAFDAAQDRLYVGSQDKAYIFEGASRLGSTSSSPALMVQGPTGVWIIGFAFAP